MTHHTDQDTHHTKPHTPTDECCASKNQDDVQKTDSCCMSSANETEKMQTKQPLHLISIILIIAVAANIISMSWFTFSVNAKLNDAIEQTEPTVGTLTLIVPSDCSQCGEFNQERKTFTNLNVSISEEIRLDGSSEQAQALITLHKITKLPAMIFSADKKIREDLIKTTQESGATKSGEKELVWETTRAPYLNITSNQIEGLVHITYLTDSSCQNCYDVVSAQRGALGRFGLGISSEDIVDISSPKGAELLKTYSITKVPTVILSSQAQAYDALMQVWSQVGTQETDGSYIFRELGAINGVYKDLNTGKIVEPEVEK